MIATHITYNALPFVTIAERKQISDYLDTLIESDRGLQPQAAQDLLSENFALSPSQAKAEYQHWLKDVT